MSQSPADDVVERTQDPTGTAAASPSVPFGFPTPSEADEADVVEQATDVPIDEDEYR